MNSQLPSGRGRPDVADAAAAAHPHSCLSSLIDGDAQAMPAACGLWRDDAAARQKWHTYHLIGDVMRSEELAGAPARDAAFLNRLRGTLAAEPVLLAPTPPQRRRVPWLLSGAVAAGFMAVAGVLLLTQQGAVPADPRAGSVLAAAAGQGADGQPGGARRRLVSDQGVIRDARLDEYLRAHQAARGGFGAALPGGALRRVDVVVPAAPDR